MRRNRRRLAIAIIVLLAIGGGTVALLRLATGGPAISAAASRWLGRRVEVGNVDVVLGRRIRVHVTDVRVYDPENDGPPVLEIPRAQGEHRWPLLLAGQLLPREWRLDAPVLRIRAGAAGDGDAPDLPPLGLVVRDGTIELDVPGSGEFRIDELSLDAQRSGIPPRMTGHATARVHHEKRELGRFEAQIEGELDDLTAALELENVPLASLPPIAGGELSPQGVANGRLRIGYAPEALRVYVEARVDDFEVTLPTFDRPLAPTETRIDASVSWADGTLAIQAREIQLDDIVIDGTLRVETTDDRLRADLRFAAFEPGTPAGGRLNPISLLGHRFASWDDIHGRIDSGRVEDLRLRVNLPLQGVGDAIAFNGRLRAGEFQVTARLQDGTYRPSPGASPLESMSGNVAILGNRLEVRSARMWRDAKPLPEIDLVLDGMHRLVRLPENERSTPRGAGVPTPGLGPALAALSSRSSRPGGEPVEITASDLELYYPAFVLPLRDATATLSFPDDTLRVREGRGVLGGVPAQFQVLWDPSGPRVDVRVKYLEGDAPRRRRKGSHWLRADVAIPALSLGGWTFESATARVEAIGANVSLDDVKASLSNGRATAKGDLSLAHAGYAPFDFDVDVDDADLAGLNASLGFPSGSLTGLANTEGHVAGRLEPGTPFLARADVTMDVRARKGTVANLPGSIVLARLPSLQGIRGLFGRPLPYDTLSASFRIREGVIRTENVSLAGPELRVLCAGEIQLLPEDKPSDLVIAFLFLETVDRVIEKLPVVGSWMLGDNNSLVALYVQLQGPWAQPSASLVPPDSLRTAAGWAGKIIDVGTNQLRKLLALPGLPTRSPVAPLSQPTPEGPANGPSPG